MTRTTADNKNGSIEAWYVSQVLEKLDCSYIKIIETDTDVNCQLVCGFQSKHSKILQRISKVFSIVKGYQADQNYILTLNIKVISNKVDEYYLLFFHEVLSNWNKKNIYLLSGTEYSNRSAKLSNESYNYLKNLSRNVWNDLSVYGLGVKYQPQQYVFSHYEFSETLTTIPEYYLITVDDWGKFAQATIDAQLGEEINLEKQKMAFLMGQSKSLSKESKVQDFSQKEIFDKELLQEIFKYLSPKNNTTVTFFKPHIIKDSKGEDKADEQKTHKTKIEDRVKELQGEIDSYTPYPNKDIKRGKVVFLNRILLFNTINPKFSINMCLACAKDITSEKQYKDVLSGKNNRTANLLSSINPPKQ